MAETYRIRRTGSGLTLAALERPGLRSVTLQLWVGAGSRWEAEGEAGAAHLLEHVVMRCTQGYPRDGELLCLLGETGSRFWARTALDAVTFQVQGLPENLGVALDALVEVAFAPRFDPEVISQEVCRVRAELAFPARGAAPPESLGASRCPRG
ncbi:MAG: insulinase family protein [Acetobacteraceae bacterium]|nr:insulinase family protein [Acetobacteraceae bacterium]